MKVIYHNCNVCGRGLIEDKEFAMGMCLICATETVPDEPKERKMVKRGCRKLNPDSQTQQME